MDLRKRKFVEFLFQNEGWYSDHPADSGGKTILGITQKNHPEIFNKIYYYYQQGKLEEAKRYAEDFYWSHYYDKRYNEYSVRLAWKLFDLSVNMGVKRVIKLLQKAVNKLSGKEVLKVDGIYGQKTHEAVKKLDHDKLVEVLVKLAWEYYKSLSVFNVFGRGWKNRLLKFVRATQRGVSIIEYSLYNEDPKILL